MLLRRICARRALSFAAALSASGAVSTSSTAWCVALAISFVSAVAGSAPRALSLSAGFFGESRLCMAARIDCATTPSTADVYADSRRGGLGTPDHEPSSALYLAVRCSCKLPST
jgi:hypothetical protein